LRGRHPVPQLTPSLPSLRIPPAPRLRCGTGGWGAGRSLHHTGRRRKAGQHRWY
jgi:hypothetical protein